MTGDPFRSLAPNLQYSIALVRGRSGDREFGGEPVLEPTVQRVGAEIALHDEPGVRLEVEPGQPEFEHAVQFVFAHPDRGVRADRHEAQVCGNIFGGDGVDVSDAHDFGITAHKVEGAAIHIDRPYRGVWRLNSESEGDRSPSTAQIEQVSTGWRRGAVSQ